MYKSIILFLVLIISQAEYLDNRNFTLPNNVFDMQYSPDQKYLYIITQSPNNGLYYYNGFTMKQISSISFPAQFSPQSLTISQDNKYVGVGSNGGQVKIYQQQNGTLVSKKQQNFTSTSKINDLAFSLDSQQVLLGTQQGIIYLWKWNQQSQPSISQNFTTDLYALVWSRTNTKEFWVGGGVGTNDKLTIYQVQETNGTNGTTVTTIVQNLTLPGKNSVPSDLTAGSNVRMNAGSIYRVGSSGNIYIYDSVSRAESILNESALGPLSKISVSNDEQFIAISATSLVGSFNRTNGTTYVFSTYPSSLPTFALTSTGNNLILSPDAATGNVRGYCQEGNFYQPNNKQCIACDASCSICTGSSSVCQLCQNRFYLQGQACLKCVDGCQTCQNGNSCDSCRQADGFQPDGNVCKCKDGTFDQTDACLNCVTGCQICNDTTTCQTCWSERGFQPSGSVCTCANRFYELNNTCNACQRGCFVCTDGQTCSQCDSQNHYVTGTNNTCVCDTANRFIDDGTLCICQPGYYQDLGVCLKCPMGCTQCSTANNCSACEPDKTIRDNVCKCQIGSYIDDNDTCQLCNASIDNCAQCDTASTCKKCQQNENRELINGQCPCQSTFFEQNSTCLACGIDGCLTCLNTQNCTVCDTSNNWQVNTQTSLCSCMKKYVEVANLCQSCPLGCNICDQNKTCSECDIVEHWVLDGLNGCKCESSYYFDNASSICSICMAGCLDCDSVDVCKTCNTPDHFILVGNNCVCEETYYLSSRNCTLCSVAIRNCNTCNNANACLTCKNPFKLKSPTLCGCDDGKYVDGNLCSDCPQECQKCEDADKCTQCKSGYDLQDGLCKNDGLDTLVIVMIVVAVLAVAGAGFAIIKCIKKKRSPLQQEGYESMQNQD